MPVPICVVFGFLITICSYVLVRAWSEVTEDYPVIGHILAGITIAIWSCFLGVGVKAVTKNSTKNVLEDYHRVKIETVITTVQSEGNLIKQDTTYRYK